MGATSALMSWSYPREPPTSPFPGDYLEQRQQHDEHDRQRPEHRRPHRHPLRRRPVTMRRRPRPAAPRGGLERSRIIAPGIALELLNPRPHHRKLPLEPHDLLRPRNRTRLMAGLQLEPAPHL